MQTFCLQVLPLLLPGFQLSQKQKGETESKDASTPHPHLGPGPRSLVGDEGPGTQAEAYRWRSQSLPLGYQLCDVSERG